MKRKRYIVFVLLILLVLGYFLIKNSALKKTAPIASITVDDMAPLSLELVYQGKKPFGVGSVQSMAITDDYFVIAGRPSGSGAMGGEINNRLIIVSKTELRDVTRDLLGTGTTYELGHANGMTYDTLRRQLVVVGIRNEDGKCDGVATIDVKGLKMCDERLLPCFGNGIAYDDVSDTYILRDNNMIRIVNNTLDRVLFEKRVVSDLTKQDICYHDGCIYMVNWAWHDYDARAVGIRTDENVIYQVDMDNNYAVRAFVVREPRIEMESIDFDNGEAYILFNGGGFKWEYFYIYRVSFGEID